MTFSKENLSRSIPTMELQLRYLAFVSTVIGISTTSKNIPVFLKADYRDGKLTLICSVTSLVFKTVIHDPRGKIVGSCSAPIHQLDVRTCSTPETLLDLDLNRTILTINNPENKSIEGVWKCSHGTNRGSDDVYVQPYFKPYNFSQSEQDAEVSTCSEFVFIAISVTCVVTVGILHINTKYSVQKRICRTIFQSRVFNTLKWTFTRSRTRTTSRDSEMEGLIEGNTIRLQLDMDRKEFYVAAIGRKAVYCLDVYGAVKWLVKVPSPRSIAIVPNTKDTTLLFASHKSSAIYKLICKEQNGSERYKPELIEMEAEDETALEEDKIKLPEYISYDHDNCLLYTEVANGHVSVYHLEKQKRN
ncbi:uncharacterized protein LOC143044298 isoform X4 [Mytilus galloprovincialis]|uniref:uncharacterized protein LOC143044298 isoform X4 n=1 Tax=Mytilus galloprovincialis TaxID=29158 RepID=UPI003F7B8259